MFNQLDSPSQRSFQNGSHSFLSQPSAPCMYHQGQFVTNFCKLQSCLMPLCPKCIAQHLEKHKQQGQHADIETVDELQEQTLELIRVQLINLNKAIQQINLFRDSKSDAHGQLHDMVSHARQQVQRLIDAFFDQLLSDLEVVTKNDKSGLDQEISQMERTLHMKIQELQTVEQKLKTPKFLKQIIHLQTSNFIPELQQQTTECEAFIEEMSKKTLDILVDESKLYVINVDLAKYINIKNATYYSDNLQKSHVAQKQHPYLGKSSIHSSIKQGAESRQDTQQNYVSNGFQINYPDYFEPMSQLKFIHYFTDKSLFIYNLDNSMKQWNEIKLNSIIPSKSTSIRTPQGDIYVIGGIVNNQICNFILKYDFKTSTLQQIETLVQPRHSCAAVYLNQKLYVLAGQSLNEDSITIEQIDLSGSKSKSYGQRPNLPKMQIGGVGLSVCAFRQFIIKTAPMEVFDTRTLRWVYQNVNINKGVGLIQVNNSNILVFGNGQYGQLKMIDQQQIQFKFEQLTNEPRFGQVNNGSLIHQGKIIAIVNNKQLAIGSNEGWQLF